MLRRLLQSDEFAVNHQDDFFFYRQNVRQVLELILAYEKVILAAEICHAKGF